MAAFASRRADTLGLGDWARSLRDQKNRVRSDGRVGYASEAGASANTCLGDQPVPALEEINADVEFSGKEIDAAAFELLWHQHVTPRLSNAPEAGC
jgi:hypothetical protein